MMIDETFVKENRWFGEGGYRRISLVRFMNKSS